MIAVIGLRKENVARVGTALLAHGDTMLAAPDVAAALELFGTEHPRVVVLEPRAGVDVGAACHALRESLACREAEIVAFVGEADARSIQGLLDVGVNDFFVESLPDEALRARLQVARNAGELAVVKHDIDADLDQFFQMTLDHLCVAGVDGYFKRLNPAWTATFGWSVAELCSRPWLEFVHPDDLAATAASGRKLGAGTATTSLVNRYRCRDGGYRWLEWRSAPVVERGLIYAAARDVTAQRAQQEELRELTESLSTMLNSIGDGVIAVDAHGAVVRMNPIAEQLTGWRIDEAHARPFAVVFNTIDASTRGAIDDPTARAMRANVAVALGENVLLVRRDGSEIPIDDSCAPIRNSEGVVSGAILVFRDTTAETLAKRTRENIQRQLVLTDRMASVGTLAAGIGHEINNPLSFVIGNLDLVIEEIRELAGGSASARIRALEELTTEARAGAERIRKIVRGLKPFSSSKEDRPTVLDIREVLELAINMTFNEIRHRARLVKDYAEIPPVEADEARLSQVFMNLLVNAAHSIAEGNTSANEIRILTSTDAAGRAVVEVRDTGVGIPDHLLGRIFDPFFTTKPIGIGTGLGLSICHSIVAALHGELTVTSKVGHGTTFRVVLPPSSVQPVALASSEAPRLTTDRASVLIVDDEPAVGVTLSRVLRHHDTTVLTKAREALELICSGKHFDVILSDLMMPEMSGMELYEQLVQRCPAAAQRIVFISGGAFTTTASTFLDSVPNERLEKPFDLKAVRAMIQRFVKQPSA